MIGFVCYQISQSTAEEEASYFTGEIEPAWQPNANTVLPAGSYRVINGQIYRILPGVASPKVASSLRCPEDVQATGGDDGSCGSPH